MDEGPQVAALPPVWSILHQLYLYTSQLDNAIQQLCDVSISHDSNSTCSSLHSFCTTTILASNHKDAFLEPTRNLRTRKQERTLRSMILSSTDKHGWARCAEHVTTLSLLHKRLGDDVMSVILTRSSLFVRVGDTNYVQITGIPLYNVLALSHTPLLAKCNPMKSRRHSQQLKQNAKQLKQKEIDASAQDEINEPPAKKSKLSDVNQDVVDSHTTDDSTIIPQPVITISKPALVSRDPPCMPVSAGGTGIQMKAVGKAQMGRWVEYSRRKWRRKQSTARAGGIDITNQAERCINKRVCYISNTSFRKMGVMYSTSSTEALNKCHDLNVCKVSRRGAIRLVTNIFTSKPASHKKQENHTRKKIDRLPKRFQPLIPLFLLLLSNYKRKEKKLVHILNRIATPIRRELKEGGEMPLILQSQCNQCQVMKFLVCALNAIIPKQLWGSPQNKKHFFSHVQRFVVSLRKWEKMNVRQVVQGIRTSHCQWLRPGRQRRNSRSDSYKQTEMIGRFYLWLMTLVVELVKGFFYATEHCNYHNRVVYFRKPVWNQLCKTALDERGDMFCQLSQEDVDYLLFRGKCLGVSNIRFMPKTSSLRPITNLGAAAKLNSGQFVLGRCGQRETKSVNFQLLDLFTILKFEKSRRPDSSSCLGYKDIHRGLNGFSSRLSKTPGARRPLYFVAIDTTNCFDSVQIRLLYSIIQKKILTQKSYLLRRFATVMVSNGSIRRSFIKIGTTRELCQPFLKHVEGTSLRNAIFIDMVTYPVIDRLQLLSQLKNHLFKNIVKFRSQFFRQTKGIPQGSCISSLLCSYYYDEMVTELLPKSDAETLLIHYVDDFLLVTHDHNKAKMFLQTMTVGVPKYNCFVNVSKTSTNFSVGEDGSVALDDKKEWMAWCGLLINTRNLEIRSDYSRYANKKIRDHLTVNTHSRPFHNLHRLVRRSVQLKCQPIFLDCELLSEKTVLCNIYQLFLLVAVKTHAAVRALQLRGAALKKYTKFLFSVIKQCSKVFYRRATITCRKNGTTSSFTLPLELCTWLCCHAYKRVFQTKDSGGYRLLVKILSSQISSVADTMGLPQVKRCLRATTVADCQPIISLSC